MKVVEATPKGQQEAQKKLSELKSGDVVRFPDTTYAQALVGKDEETFYMLIATKPEKTGRATLVSLDGRLIIERDADRKVVVHEVEIAISKAVYE